MPEFFDTDEAVRVCRSYGLSVLVGLSQLEELLANLDTDEKVADVQEVAGQISEHAAAILGKMGEIVDALENGSASTPTADSLEEEEPLV